MLRDCEMKSREGEGSELQKVCQQDQLGNWGWIIKICFGKRMLGKTYVFCDPRFSCTHMFGETYFLCYDFFIHICLARPMYLSSHDLFVRSHIFGEIRFLLLWTIEFWHKYHFVNYHILQDPELHHCGRWAQWKCWYMFSEGLWKLYWRRFPRAYMVTETTENCTLVTDRDTRGCGSKTNSIKSNEESHASISSTILTD